MMMSKPFQDVQNPKANEYYAQKQIFLTGATGLVGKVLLETFLRKMPEVGKIFVLIRPRKNRAGEFQPPAHTFKKEILRSSAFDYLRELHGKEFEHFVQCRVEPLSGDLSKDRLGMTSEDYERVAGEIDIIINSGAVAVFDAPLDSAFETNTLGPRRILELGRKSPRKPFVAHISTCYVNINVGPVFESLSGNPLRDASGEKIEVEDEVRAIREHLETIRAETGDDRGEHGSGASRNGGGKGRKLTERMIREGLKWGRKREWNDTYTFTKVLGEHLFSKDLGDLPGMILRPSIIESALYSPAPGWIDGLRMADPWIIRYGRGQLAEFPGNPSAVIDIVPVDLVVNALLMSIAWTHLSGGHDYPRIYQMASGVQNPIFLKEFRDLVGDYYQAAPLRANSEPGNLRRPTFPASEEFIDTIERRHIRRLRMIDKLYGLVGFTAWARKKRSRARSALVQLERLRNTAEIYGPYCECDARFINFNLRRVWNEMPSGLKEKFPFNLEPLNWQGYVQKVHLPGLERYALRRPRQAPDSGAADNHGGKAEAQPGELPGPNEEKDPHLWKRGEKLLSLTYGKDSTERNIHAAPAYTKGIRKVSKCLINLIAKQYLSLKCTGLENVPERGPFILVSNHASHIDTGLLLAALGNKSMTVHPIAAADYWFKSRLIRGILQSTLSAIPFARHSRNIPRALALPAGVLRAGRSIIFYPEGTRCTDGEMQAFKSTVGLLALATATPILPACIEGSYEALPKGRKLIRRHPVRVHFGPLKAIEPYINQLDRQSVSKIAKDLAADTQFTVKMLQEMQASEKNHTSGKKRESNKVEGFKEEGFALQEKSD